MNPSCKLIPFTSKGFEKGELKQHMDKGPEIGPNDQITLPLIKHQSIPVEHVKIEKLDMEILNQTLQINNGLYRKSLSLKQFEYCFCRISWQKVQKSKRTKRGNDEDK